MDRITHRESVAEIHVLDLMPFREELGVYSGRSHGEHVRTAVALDRLDLDDSIGRVIIHVPVDTWDMSTSFWLGLFGESVRRLGPAGFRARYEFKGGIPQEDVDAGIADALREGDPLRPG